jgi:hypothetical protein
VPDDLLFYQLIHRGKLMPNWTDCNADVYYSDGRSAIINDTGYIVRLTDETIEVAYDDDEGAVCYRGKNKGDGHFELIAPERNGKASLHCFTDSSFLEGYWHEGDGRGMWRILLK